MDNFDAEQDKQSAKQWRGVRHHLLRVCISQGLYKGGPFKPRHLHQGAYGAYVITVHRAK